MQHGLTVEEAAESLGYQHTESLRRRIRVLRKRGMVSDHGTPPAMYLGRPAGEGPAAITLYWVHPKYFLIGRKIDQAAFPTQKDSSDE